MILAGSRFMRTAVASALVVATTAVAAAQTYTPPYNPQQYNTPPSLPVRGSHDMAQGVGVGLADAIRAYAKHMGIAGVFIDPSVPNRRVRYFVTNVDDATIFEELLRSNGLESAEENGILHVAPPDVLATRYGRSMTRLEVRRGAPTLVVPILRAATNERVAFIPNNSDHAVYAIGPVSEIEKARQLLNKSLAGRTEIIRFKNGLNPIDVAEELAGIIDDAAGSIRPIPAQDAIAVTGSDDFIVHAKEEMAKLDVPPAQVFYTASIIEITPQSTTIQRGVTLGPIVAGRAASGASSVGTLTGGAVPIGQVSATLDALVATGQARILKRLTIAASSGSTASNAFDNQVPILVNDPLTAVPTVRTVNAGVGIQVKPFVGTEGVTTQITTKYTEITGTASNGYPTISERTSTNDVTTGKDQTILISGLYSDESLVARSSAPPFSYIPIVGGVFRHRSETENHNEVVIVVTPTISDGKTTGPAFSFPSIPEALRRGGIAPSPAPATHQ
jgi:type II secretory pathway component GspD/PulD (secretin)